MRFGVVFIPFRFCLQSRVTLWRVAAQARTENFRVALGTVWSMQEAKTSLPLRFFFFFCKCWVFNPFRLLSVMSLLNCVMNSFM